MTSFVDIKQVASRYHFTSEDLSVVFMDIKNQEGYRIVRMFVLGGYEDPAVLGRIGADDVLALIPTEVDLGYWFSKWFVVLLASNDRITQVLKIKTRNVQWAISYAKKHAPNMNVVVGGTLSDYEELLRDASEVVTQQKFQAISYDNRDDIEGVNAQALLMMKHYPNDVASVWQINNWAQNVNHRE